jgi:hypothetical protein
MGIIGTISSLRDLIADYGDIRIVEVVRREKHVYNTSDSCVCCGATVPEGRQICLICEKGGNENEM